MMVMMMKVMTISLSKEKNLLIGKVFLLTLHYYLLVKWPDKSTRSYAMLNFETLNIAKKCLEYAIYDVHLPDISFTNFFLCHFQNLA